MSLFSKIQDKAKEIFAAASTRFIGFDRSKLDHLMAEVRKLLPPLILAAEATGDDVATQKQIVAAAVGEWYDREILPLDLPGPDSIEDPMLRAACIEIAGDLVDFGHDLIAAYEALKKGE